MHRSDFHFDLPQELIAQYPLPERTASRLLTLVGSSTGSSVQDRLFKMLQLLNRELKLLELRQHARDELGDLFDIKDFHRVVLLHHRMPLEILERVVQDYIDRASNPPPAPRQPGGRRTTSP